MCRACGIEAGADPRWLSVCDFCSKQSGWNSRTQSQTTRNPLTSGRSVEEVPVKEKAALMKGGLGYVNPRADKTPVERAEGEPAASWSQKMPSIILGRVAAIASVRRASVVNRKMGGSTGRNRGPQWAVVVRLRCNPVPSRSK